MKKVKTAVIPVAGYGTRFLPYTKAIPKAMLPVVNRPAVEIILEEAINSGIEKIALVVGQNKENLEKHFGENTDLNRVLQGETKKVYLDAINKFKDYQIEFIEQTEQKGTAHAIYITKDFVGNEPFAVMFGDDLMYCQRQPVISQLIDKFNETGKTVIGCKRVPLSQVSKYASVEFSSQQENLFKITKIIEKPKQEDVKSNLSPLGRYVCEPEIFDIIKDLKPGANNEYQFTDALDIISRQRGGYALEFEGTRYDMGDRLGFLKANVEFGLRDEGLSEQFKEYLLNLFNN